jgi:hypothetical protein
MVNKPKELLHVVEFVPQSHEVFLASVSWTVAA